MEYSVSQRSIHWGGILCWLAGAAALATAHGAGPDLVYLPEVDFDMDKFLADVERIYKEKGKIVRRV